MALSDNREVDFRDYLRTLYRRKWTIVVVTVLATGSAVGFSETVKPSYSATAKVLLQPSPSQQALSSTGGSIPANPQDEIARLQGPGVARLVRRQLGSTPPLSASPVTNTDIIQITASSTQPVGAARIANTYANTYVSYRHTQAVNDLLAAAGTVQARISSLQAQISSINLASTHGSLGQQGSTPPTVSPQVTALEQQVVVLEQQLSTLQSDAALGSAGAEVVQPAAVPSAPSSPKKVENGLFGLLGGLLLGVALAFVREALDDTIVVREDLDRAQPDLPVLAQIPQFSSRKRDGAELVSIARPHSDAAEAYRTLRTSVQFTALDRSLGTLQFTSPRSTEGKTTTVANLAATLAQVGQQVVLVDCDLRRSRVHTLFGLGNDVGFTSVLLGEVPLSTALQDVPNQLGLRLLASGARPPNPSELLASQRTAEVITSLVEVADLVLIDSPPVLPVTDAVALAPRVDATLMVVQAGVTTAKDLSRALEVLGQVDASVIGTVFNAVPPGGRYGYRYGYYGYGYGSPSGKEAVSVQPGGQVQPSRE